MNIKATIACVVLAVVTSAAQTPVPQTPVPKPTAKPATASAPKFKAIWEPVPFDKDLNLNAIACVGPETCWAVGAKSTILFTTDGGTKWQVQMGGDPEATDDDLSKVFFVDATHGWAMTDSGKVLGTTDGRTWAELSTVSGTSRGVWFLTPQNGVEIENPDSTTQSTMQRSNDGGRGWKPESRCSVDASVGGLPRKLPCRLHAAHFLSPTTGFAGGGAAINMGTNVATFGTTTDGGQTWTMSVIPDTTRQVTAVTFWTDKDGIVVLDDGEEVHWTGDGGTTWTRSVKQKAWPSIYGVGDGKIIVGIGQGGGIGYSFNGGRNFTSRPLALPATAQAVTFPDAQHGYLVGHHAMAYRYRIVPIDYTRPGMIAAMAP
jgi:Photosynthesis system II assembly factor YCF48